jgi:Na+-driven multidrug efflux pump
MNNNSNNKRIAKNSVVLYIRMFITMIVSLYTSRVILSTLGVVDYGIYNVVGGIVSMMSILNGALSSATQRFVSYEIGRNNQKQVQNVFSHSVLTYVLIAIAILILAETVGLWFLNTKLNIPESRMIAARWVYQFSILTFVVSVVQAPYNALIVSYEKISTYAYVSIAEVFLKLLIVFVLVWLGFDKLKLYALLTFSVALLIAIFYKIYCNRKLNIHYKLNWDRSIFNSLLHFSGWSLMSNLAWMTMYEGLNILLNIFFGPSINAARGVAFQVNGVVSTFITNLRTAVNPQVVKLYAVGSIEYMKDLVFESAKYSYFLLLFISLPILLETHTILGLWLKVVPSYAVLFCQLTIVNTLIFNFDISFAVVFQAINRIKENQLMSCIVYLFVLPVSYFLLKIGYRAEVIFYIQIIATFIVSFVVKIYLLVKICKWKIREYFDRLLWPVIKVSLAAIVIPLFLRINLDEGLLRFFLLMFVSVISISTSVYFLGLNKSTRAKTLSLIIDKFNSVWTK